MDIFSTREIATFFWFILFIAYALLHKGVRKSIGDIFSTLLSSSLLMIFFQCLAYVVAIVILLYSIDLWHIGQLKNTLIWFFIIALLSIGKAVEARNGSLLVRHLITDNLKIIVLLEFIIDFYPLNLFAELLLVPVLAFLAMMSAFTTDEKEHRPVKTLVDYTLSAVGVFLILRALYQLYIHFEGFVQLSTFADFSLLPLLSLLYLPFIYCLYLYTKYSNVFRRLSFFVDDKKLRTYAKYRAVKAFHIHVNRLQEWASSFVWSDIKTKKDITSSIALYKTLIKRSKNPENVKKEDGWSPFKATHFLKDHGIITNLYHPTNDKEWFASSTSNKMSDTFRSNTVDYYISGNQQAATKLKLSFHIYDQEDDEETIAWIKNIMITLTQHANLSEDDSAEQDTYLSLGKTLTFEHATITLREEKHEHLKDEQYVHLEITHKKHNK